jgi:predicted Zn-dependent protease
MERKLGDLMVGDLGHRACAGPGGTEALSALLHRIEPKAKDLDVRVVNLPIVNAVTLPGGKIVIFDRLIQEAQTPDEVAGVIAHEIGHVRHRDVMESLLRQLGLSVLLGGLDGNVGGYTNALLAATYSRDAETRADGYAIDALNRAGVSPEPIAQFFRRLSGGEMKGEGAARIMNYFSTHPMSTDRAARFDHAANAHGKYSPALDADAWSKLRAICSSDPDAEKPGFRF